MAFRGSERNAVVGVSENLKVYWWCKNIGKKQANLE